MIYFDESGYTGQDLTNQEQPFFTLASIRISDEEVDVIKNDIGYDKWMGNELHFSHMYSNYEGRNMLMNVFTHPLMDSNHVLLSFANKRYCIYAHLVNMLVETYYHYNGINIYEGAKHLMLANSLYFFSVLHPKQTLIKDFENCFVEMVRNPSDFSIADFYLITEILMSDKDTQVAFRDLLSEIPPTSVCIDNALSNNKFYMDLTIPLFSCLIQEWYKKTGVKDDVLFDSSKPYYAGKVFLESLRDLSIPETEVGYGKGVHVYPFPVGNMEITESNNYFGIQLADCFASALNFVLTPRTDKYVKFQEELKELTMFQQVKLNIAPSSLEIISERNKESANIDPVEFLCGLHDLQ